MCGISGLFLAPGPIVPRDAATVGNMVDAQATYGSGGTGLHPGSRGGLGHRRLSSVSFGSEVSAVVSARTKLQRCRFRPSARQAA